MCIELNIHWKFTKAMNLNDILFKVQNSHIFLIVASLLITVVLIIEQTFDCRHLIKDWQHCLRMYNKKMNI